MGKVSLISATVLLWVVRWRDNLKSKLLEDCIFRKLSTTDEMDQVLSSEACCHWAYNGEKYGKSQISFCTLTNTVPNKAPRSQLQGTYSKVAAWLHACSLPFKNKTLEQMLPSDRNAVRKCRQLVLFLCTIFKKQCFFKFSNTQRIPYTRVVCSVFTKICLGIIRKGDNTFWCNVLS